MHWIIMTKNKRQRQNALRPAKTDNVVLSTGCKGIVWCKMFCADICVMNNYFGYI